MVTTRKTLLDLTAADLMSRDIVAIPRELSLRAAARELARAEVSGAPVTDACGRCVGVLSTTDLVRWLGEREGAVPDRRSAPACVCSEWQVIDFETLPAEAVGNYMTTDLITAGPATRIGELARMMLDDHIHRVIVTDDEGRPLGVVSATDILAAVAREELRGHRAAP